MTTVEIQSRAIIASKTDPHISYLRSGRLLRASGKRVGIDPMTGLTKVKPDRADWKHIHVTDDEIEAGKEKPPHKPRQRVEGEKRHKTPPQKPKPPSVPRWKQLVADARLIQHAGNETDFDREKTFRFIVSMADELEAAHAKLSQFLPLS